MGDAAVLGIKKAKDLFKEGKVAESAKVLEDLSGGAKATSEAATHVPGRVRSRINIANGRTETTPLRE